MMDHTPQHVQESITRAIKVVDELCHGKRRWTMSIPARPDEDPGLVISIALSKAATCIRQMQSENAALRERLKLNGVQVPD